MDRSSLCLLLESSKNGGFIVKSKDLKKSLWNSLQRYQTDETLHMVLHLYLYLTVISAQNIRWKAMKVNRSYGKNSFWGGWRASKPEVCGRVHPDNARAPTLQVWGGSSHDEGSSVFQAMNRVGCHYLIGLPFTQTDLKRIYWRTKNLDKTILETKQSKMFDQIPLKGSSTKKISIA